MAVTSPFSGRPSCDARRAGRLPEYFGQGRDAVVAVARRGRPLHRKVYRQVPPKVEYSLTGFGTSLNTALAPLGEWGEEHMERIGALP
ncbi:transcriptional regulator [Streptomyces sp. PRKS01-65]|nr:transcriptional regulator [Streptomyces harenosi]